MVIELTTCHIVTTHWYGIHTCNDIIIYSDNYEFHIQTLNLPMTWKLCTIYFLLLHYLPLVITWRYPWYSHWMIQFTVMSVLYKCCDSTLYVSYHSSWFINRMIVFIHIFFVFLSHHVDHILTAHGTLTDQLFIICC